jgi:hypothetical protein
MYLYGIIVCCAQTVRIHPALPDSTGIRRGTACECENDTESVAMIVP